MAESTNTLSAHALAVDQALENANTDVEVTLAEEVRRYRATDRLRWLGSLMSLSEAIAVGFMVVFALLDTPVAWHMYVTAGTLVLAVVAARHTEQLHRKWSAELLQELNRMRDTCDETLQQAEQAIAPYLVDEPDDQLH